MSKVHCIHGGGSEGASYCKPNKIHEPETLHPKNYLASKFSTLKYARLKHLQLILIYFNKICGRSLDPKNTEGVNFQPKKISQTTPPSSVMSTVRIFPEVKCFAQEYHDPHQSLNTDHSIWNPVYSYLL